MSSSHPDLAPGRRPPDRPHPGPGGGARRARHARRPGDRARALGPGHAHPGGSDRDRAQEQPGPAGDAERPADRAGGLPRRPRRLHPLGPDLQRLRLHRRGRAARRFRRHRHRARHLLVRLQPGAVHRPERRQADAARHHPRAGAGHRAAHRGRRGQPGRAGVAAVPERAAGAGGGGAGRARGRPHRRAPAPGAGPPGRGRRDAAGRAPRRGAEGTGAGEAAAGAQHRGHGHPGAGAAHGGGAAAGRAAHLRVRPLPAAVRRRGAARAGDRQQPQPPGRALAGGGRAHRSPRRAGQLSPHPPLQRGVGRLRVPRRRPGPAGGAGDPGRPAAAGQLLSRATGSRHSSGRRRGTAAGSPSRPRASAPRCGSRTPATRSTTTGSR